MKKEDFYYDLPEELIAQHPMEKRSESKLLHLNRENETFEDCHFYDIVKFFHPGDVLVVNNTKVIPARLFGSRENKEEKIEVLLLKETGQKQWECLVKPGRKMKIGTKIIFSPRLSATVVDITEEGSRIIAFHYDGIFEEILDELGEMPLPPYIHEKLEDKDRYQTIYAKHRGSAAAPTSGLHFTEEILSQLREKGVKILPITLHVGLGTFRPVKEDDILDHVMHSEYFEISEEVAKEINEGKKAGKRIIAVGTTSVRTLESQTDEKGLLKPGKGWTDIFIYPGYDFEMVDAMVTNFHLPESTLLMLISAFANREFILKAYEHAIKERYRFFSFGDAMFIE
ncbi:tRNA preQ1(34) S-adenosylmethionine ribosyltransferase-isomerase QueA [Peptoniphilus sp. KCTC 25270]|uniref:tRNA preQ1(34) S-adenosylmethionine ribosyltransferase-isomerase QueA n=1 Tax=Peptoniphilus sp. KCTC 25270 TaxID=2897414 RepID=UPI002104504D|nr:tRNA preQ1(34) S-adenosylmethionine ribosyltransferase-isomerase QueA [Peptoniphilus sp. KCTC 25270]